MNDYKVGDKFIAEITDLTERTATVELKGTTGIEIRLTAHISAVLQLELSKYPF